MAQDKETLIDVWHKQFQTSYQPFNELQALWLRNLEEMIEFEINAMHTYTTAWLALCKTCVSPQDVQDLPQMGESYMTAWCQMNKALLEHAQERQRRVISFREKINQVL
ncbi:phasin family protein [Allopseudospirillum japonicum]|uniref:Phasin family protein n=1 Tax=Allopseudospirillum japonicum TaxID=64971 RepID=A0A1H6RTX1_9GAMM|nr:hypothetical protein [Allopseudospirillum japonicum]SEI59189.1 phasin family protein [Allopseudospirillum japonicum]